jgi:hypothetical protein
LLIVFVAACVALFVLARLTIFQPESDASPISMTPTALGAATGPGTRPAQPGGGQNQGQIAIDPPQGTINTLITVTGQGWWPGEPVFVFLRAQGEEDEPGYAYAAAVADDLGQIETALTFPNELRWLESQWADVIARGSRSEFEASTRFALIAPTATGTPPPPPPPPTLTATQTPTPTDTPLPTPTPTPQEITDWLGEYFANPALAGDPVFRRNDVAVDFLWGTAAPGEGMPADTFSVRWTRTLPFGEGTYRFTIAADDGVRFWIDGQLFVDDWQNGPLRPHSFDLDLPEGAHALQVDYYENLGDAGAQLTWELVELPTATPTSSATATAEPTHTLPPEPTDSSPPTPTSPPAANAWLGQYYANPFLDGDPVLVREDAELSFDWGLGSPGEGVPAENFSARWTRDVWLPAGAYRFLLEVDDGARFWVDGELLIDTWNLATYQTHTAEIELSDGVHSMKVEYFETIVEASIYLWIEKATTPPAASLAPALLEPPTALVWMTPGRRQPLPRGWATGESFAS